MGKSWLIFFIFIFLRCWGGGGWRSVWIGGCGGQADNMWDCHPHPQITPPPMFLEMIGISGLICFICVCVGSTIPSPAAGKFHYSFLILLSEWYIWLKLLDLWHSLRNEVFHWKRSARGCFKPFMSLRTSSLWVCFIVKVGRISYLRFMLFCRIIPCAGRRAPLFGWL